MKDKPLVRVRDIMKEDYDLIDGMDTVHKALLQQKHFAQAKCFIVNVRDEHDEYGIVLLADIAKKVIAKNRAPERVNMYEIMTKPMVCVSPDMNIRYCSRLLENCGFDRIPVVEKKHVIGIVSYMDIVFNSIAAH